MRALRSASPILLLFLGWGCAYLVLGRGLLPGPVSALHLLLASALSDPIISAQGGGSWGYAPHVFSTLWHVLLGAGGGILAGVTLSLLAAQWPLWLTAADTLLETIRTIPPLIFVPFAAIAFSGSDLVQLVSVAVYATLMTSVYTLTAIGNLQPNLLQLSTLLGANKYRRTITVQLPAILPWLIGPVRFVLAFSLGISVVAEYLASPTGIGRVMKYVMALSDISLIMVGVLWTVALAFLLDGITVLSFSVFIRWTGRRQLMEWMAK
jgi:NitT/TauT family transport system permease protein